VSPETVTTKDMERKEPKLPLRRSRPVTYAVRYVHLVESIETDARVQLREALARLLLGAARNDGAAEPSVTIEAEVTR
jgi:hypothetical protein